MAVDVDLLESASRLGLFAGLPRAELETLLAGLQPATFGEGEWVVRRGDTDVGFHIIVEGEVGVVLEDEELAILPKGSFFGEISALLNEPVVADIVSRAPLTCLVVPAPDVESFLIANPRVMFSVLQTEARRLKTMDEART